MTGKAVGRCDVKDIYIYLYDDQYMATLEPCKYFCPLTVFCEKEMEYVHSALLKSRFLWEEFP